MKLHDQRNHGYPALAQLMGPNPGMAIYKKFSILNTHDLLLRQAELLHLERELHKQGLIDRAAGLEYSEKVHELFDSNRTGVDSAQLELILKIRLRLKEYSGQRAISNTSSQLIRNR